MKQFLLVAAGTLLASNLSSSADGKQTFLDNNCNRCHSVAAHDIEATAKSESMRGTDLSTIGKDRDAEWLEKYLKKEVNVDGKQHRANFGGSDEDRQGIAEWLAQQKGG